MGCWNKTCGLSGLPIFAGERVYVFVLIQNADTSDRSYTTSFWRPVILPFETTYNDYGGGEDSDMVALNYILKSIRPVVVEQEQGDNKCHDIPISRESLGERLLFDAIHENRLFVTEWKNQPLQVDLVMFRKDIVDIILQEYTVQQYVGKGGDCGHDNNNYLKITLSTLVAELPKIIEASKQTQKTPWRYSLLTESGEFGFMNRICNHRFSTVCDLEGIILNTTTDDQEKLYILKSVCMFTMLDNFMDSVRKTWSPGGHEGSQNSDTTSYKLLNRSVDGIISALEKQYSE